MAWVKLDDQFPINAKTRSIPVEARYLFVTSLCWCAMQMNDGLFLASDVPTIATLAGVPMTVAEHLLPAFWHPEGFDCEACAQAGQTNPVPSGYIAVHCFLERNESRAQQEERRRKDRERKSPRSGSDSARSSRRIPPVSSRPVLEGFSVQSSSSDSTEPVGLSTPCAPDETWEHYAELMLAKQPPGKVKHPPSWKRTTAENALIHHAETAARWFNEFDVTPHRLAEWLIDGQPHPNAQRRETP